MHGECILGNIWLHRLFTRSSAAPSLLLTEALKSGVAVEEFWGGQLHGGSDRPTDRGGAKELEPGVYIWEVDGAALARLE